MIREICATTYSFLKAKLDGHSPNGVFYWDDADPDELERLVCRLSNTNDPERREIRNIISKVNPVSILDIACGPATELRGYREEGMAIRYLGLDKSEYMLNKAKERFPNADFISGDAENLPLADSSFQIVLLKHILEHLKSYRKAIQEALRVSNDVVIVDFFHKLLPIRWDIPLKSKKGYWNNWYSRERFEELLDTLPLSGYSKIETKGTRDQAAEIYVLHKPK